MVRLFALTENVQFVIRHITNIYIQIFITITSMKYYTTNGCDNCGIPQACTVPQVSAVPRYFYDLSSISLVLCGHTLILKLFHFSIISTEVTTSADAGQRKTVKQQE